MASKVQIAKMALQHVGDRYDISDITEATPEAEQVNLLYDDTRDALLRQHPWVFATKYTSPAALSGTAPGNWSYMYTYPTDCIKMLGIVNSLGDDQPKIRFEVARNASSTRVILTDEEQPQIFYTFLAEDTADYDPEFVMAFSYVLGARMAVPLTGDPDLANSLFQQARSVLNSAWASDSNEGIEPSIPDADWIRARA
jgi:hypothetical protein|tara:strand:- start:1367 stop:1960 length:594 start_codon:yes stop_codon:yes gene_type:complete